MNRTGTRGFTATPQPEIEANPSDKRRFSEKTVYKRYVTDRNLPEGVPDFPVHCRLVFPPAAHRTEFLMVRDRPEAISHPELPGHRKKSPLAGTIEPTTY
jgi:hypothetical protein